MYSDLARVRSNNSAMIFALLNRDFRERKISNDTASDRVAGGKIVRLQRDSVAFIRDV